MENTGRGSTGLVGNMGRGKHRFWWETLGVENTGLVENTGTQWKGKHGVKVKKKKKKKKHGEPLFRRTKSKFCYYPGSEAWV